LSIQGSNENPEGTDSDVESVLEPAAKGREQNATFALRSASEASFSAFIYAIWRRVFLKRR
jgi:hypothetical protein